MSNDYDDIAGRIEAERERERQDTRDIAALARLRSHEDFEALLSELEDTAYRHGGDADALLVQLLRGDPGQGG